MVLLEAGMASHRPLHRDSSLNISKWHDRLKDSLSIDAAKNTRTTDQSALYPGRLWEQLAVDLIVANMDSPTWGWAHSFSVELLDFWSKLDSGIRFVLVCEDRVHFVSSLIEQGESLNSISKKLDLWERRHQNMLRFHLRHPEISCLVWATQVGNQPDKFIHHLNQVWQVSFREPTASQHLMVKPNLVLLNIAQQILAGQPHKSVLEGELLSVIGPVDSVPLNTDVHTADLLSHYLKLIDRTVEKQQLHQVQEELDKHFVESKELKQQVQIETRSKQEAQAKLGAEQKASADFKKQRDTEASSKKDVQAKNKELQEEADLLLMQLHQVQEELEKHFVESKELKQQVQIETRSKQEAQAKLGAEQKASADFKKQRDTEASSKKDVQAKNKELQEEADLLLMQLHQVQEELEKHFVENKERQQEVKHLHERWFRAVQKIPALQDFEAIELVSEAGVSDPIRWRINQLNLAGRIYRPFEFQTFFEYGVVGFVFSKDANGSSPLLRWPAIAAQDQELSIIPFKGHADNPKRIATILQLGTTDWNLIQHLSKMLIYSLENGTLSPTLTKADSLLDGLFAQQQMFDKLPPLFRFDAIKVLGQQNTLTKSVLAFRLENSGLLGLGANPFEFQLQLNRISNAALQSAHLIFNEKCAKAPFEQWFSNAKSTKGQLVMALQIDAKGWDPIRWQQLSPSDQHWVQCLLMAFPSMLAVHQAGGAQLIPNFSGWEQAATELCKWSQQVVAVQTPKKETVVKMSNKAAVPAKKTKPAPQAKSAVKTGSKASPKAAPKAAPITSPKTIPKTAAKLVKPSKVHAATPKASVRKVAKATRKTTRQTQ